MYILVTDRFENCQEQALRDLMMFNNKIILDKYLLVVYICQHV